MGPIIRIKETKGDRKAHSEIWIKVSTIKEDMSHTETPQEDKEPTWFTTKSGPNHHPKMMTK